MMSEWIGVARNMDLRGYVKRGNVVKQRYVGKYGIGVRMKEHRDDFYYNETIRTVQSPDIYFTVNFCKLIDDKIPIYKTFTVKDVHKKNDGYYCNIADGITTILTNDWSLVECDVWEVLGV